MKKRATETDVLAGRRLRLRRVALGLTQRELSERLGVSFQQLHKYENGTNRISASRLDKLTRILDVRIGYFFPEPNGLVLAEPKRGPDASFLETQELLRDFAKAGPVVRRALRSLVKAIEEAERSAPA